MADTKTDAKSVQRRKMVDKPFENILNFRDVGKTINEFMGEKYWNPNWRHHTWDTADIETGSLLRARSFGQLDQVVTLI